MVLEIVFPLFGIMVIGFLAGHFDILDKAGSAFLSRFVFVIALPALAFIKLSDIPVGEFFNWQFLCVLGGGMFATLCVSLVVARFVFQDTLTAQALHGLTAMYSSTGYIGIPLILVVFGEEALAPGIVGAVITGAIFLPIAVMIAEFDRRDKTSTLSLAPIARVMCNPILIATAAGLTCSALAIRVPTPLAAICELLGDAYVPCALLSAGLFMSGGIVRTATAEISWLVFAKLVLHPAITWWLAVHVFMLEGTLATIAVLQAALPSGVPVFALAQEYKTFIARSNAVIVVSTALSVITLSGLLYFSR